MKILINFNDNDYGNTFYGVMEVLLSSYIHNSKISNNKDYLVNIINEISYPCYLLFQNDSEFLSDKYSLQDYLKINKEEIFIDEEVDLYIKKNDYGNSENIILDTDLWYNNNNAIYFH